MFDFYITPDEYEIAEQNGICKKTLEMRIREYAWDKQRALTEPVRQKRELDLPNEVIKRAAQNGIEYNLLSQRILQLNWDIEKACTEPLFDYSNHLVEVNKSRRKYPQELYELAKVNGIHERTFRRRVKNGMDMYEAATKPTATRQEIARMGKEVSSLGRFQYGRELRL
jgi:hypothetical protein